MVNIAAFSGAWPDSCRGACTCNQVSSALSRRRDRLTKLGAGLAGIGGGPFYGTGYYGGGGIGLVLVIVLILVLLGRL